MTHGMLPNLPLMIFAHLRILQSNEPDSLPLLVSRETWSVGVMNFPYPTGVRACFHTKCTVSMDAIKVQNAQMQYLQAFPACCQPMLFYVKHIFMIACDNNDLIFFLIQNRYKYLPCLESYLRIEIKSIINAQATEYLVLSQMLCLVKIRRR